MNVMISLIRENNIISCPVPVGTGLAEILPVHTDFDFPCAGRGTCRRCRVRVEGAFSPLTPEELDVFSSDELAAGFRLACCTKLEGPGKVYIPSKTFVNICSDGQMPEFEVNPFFEQYAIAIDIGTTTLGAQLYDQKGQLLGTRVMKNPQVAYGADIISRIQGALEGKGKELAGSIRDALTCLIKELIRQSSVKENEIEVAVITGNTTMLYLLAQISPETLSHAPFMADKRFGDWYSAHELLPGSGVQGRIYLPRCISAFVGGDVTTALLGSGLCQGTGTQMLIDIGTNGEIALWHNEVLYTTSTAAGPAFEGVGLSCGIYGIPGAVDRVWVEQGTVCCSTISGKESVGICGSGAIDALATMLKCGILDETGAFTEGNRFDIAANAFITNEDVRNLQLAKAAIRAGMETLLQVGDIGWDKVSKLLIAGGFGSHLDLGSASAIGLIPSGMEAKIEVVGNAALTGAAMILLRREFLEESFNLAESAITVALDSNPLFTEEYIKHMTLE